MLEFFGVMPKNAHKKRDSYEHREEEEEEVL